MNTARGPRGGSGPRREEQLFDQAIVNQLTHDMRTPLTVILGYAELLHASDLRDDQRQGLDAIVRAGEALRGAIDRLLEGVAARIEINAPATMMTARYPERSAAGASAGEPHRVAGRRRGSRTTTRRRTPS